VIWNVAQIHFVDAVYPAVGVSLAALIGISLATAPPPPEKWQPFFKKG